MFNTQRSDQVIRLRLRRGSLKSWGQTKSCNFVDVQYTSGKGLRKEQAVK